MQRRDGNKQIEAKESQKYVVPEEGLEPSRGVILGRF